MKKVNKDLRECCADDKNLQATSKSDRVTKQCKICGRKHYVMKAQSLNLKFG
jgi:ribosomal protein S14